MWCEVIEPNAFFIRVCPQVVSMHRLRLKNSLSQQFEGRENIYSVESSQALRLLIYRRAYSLKYVNLLNMLIHHPRLRHGIQASNRDYDCAGYSGWPIYVLWVCVCLGLNNDKILTIIPRECLTRAVQFDLCKSSLR